MTSELVPITGPEIIEATPTKLFEGGSAHARMMEAKASAEVLADFVKKRGLFSNIGGKNHVWVEGWTFLGSLLGVFPVVQWTKPVDGGWEARVEARTMAGNLVGAAESQCTRAEAKWKARDDYALRSMAQTRATSKALRLPLGYIMVLAGYEATPADEMPENLEPVLRASIAKVKAEKLAKATIVAQTAPEAALDPSTGQDITRATRPRIQMERPDPPLPTKVYAGSILTPHEDATQPVPGHCTLKGCGGELHIYKSTSKEHPGREYYACEKAQAMRDQALLDGSDERTAAVLVSNHFRQWK